MELIIDKKKAVLKKGSSFDYVSENRSFSDADDYTMSISLPLAGCPENIAIFGHINRMDAVTRHIILEASIIDRDFSKNGVVTVVECSDVEVKVQFLEGRSVQNFMDTFDDRYINEMSLGSYPQSTLPDKPSSAYVDIAHGASAVALPWVYDGSGDINNEVLVKNGVAEWPQFTIDTGKLSYQPYLISIAKRICIELGYTFDFSQWEKSDQVYLLVCNTLPAAWDIPQFARALPHWTASEFFEELEKILVCELEIDHKAKHIKLIMSDSIEWAESETRLPDDCIVDAFNAEVSYDDQLCQFKGVANLRYRDRGDHKWQMEECQWLIDLLKQDGKYYTEFQTLADYREWYLSKFGILGPWITGKDSERGKDVGQLIHIVETDQYALWKVVPASDSSYYYQWVDLNRFGDVVNDPDSDNDIELGFVPARLDGTDSSHGQCLFLAPSSYNEQEDLDEDGIRQPMAYSALLKGEPDSAAEYYDKIYLAYWDGTSSNHLSFPNGMNLNLPNDNLPPAPAVDERFSLRNRYKGYLSGLKVLPKEKMKVSWLSSSIPDVRSIFFIRGEKYLCEKITATFTEDGMSQLLKGDFYPLVDD